MNIGKKNNIQFDFDSEGYIRGFSNVLKLMFDTKASKFEEYAEALFSGEIDALNDLFDYLDDYTLTDYFIKDKDIKKDTNLIQFCNDKRKQSMEIIADLYTKHAIEHNVVDPTFTLDKALNIVENYYDSFYVRNCKDKVLDNFPASSKEEVAKLKTNAYKQIKGKVGIEGIKADFAKEKTVPFSQYCVDKTLDYVKALNNDIKEYCVNHNIDVPGKVTNASLFNQKLVSQVNFTVPTYLNMISDSYSKRSAAERFFSYFPFINQEAKEERNAIRRIESILINGSIYRLDDEDITKLREDSRSAINKNYYDEKLGLDKVQAKNNVVKQTVIVNEVANDKDLVETVSKVNETDNIKEKEVDNSDLLF